MPVREIAVDFVYSLNSKQNDDLMVMQNVRFEFRQNQRHYCLL